MHWFASSVILGYMSHRQENTKKIQITIKYDSIICWYYYMLSLIRWNILHSNLFCSQKKEQYINQRTTYHICIFVQSKFILIISAFDFIANNIIRLYGVGISIDCLHTLVLWNFEDLTIEWIYKWVFQELVHYNLQRRHCNVLQYMNAICETFLFRMNIRWYND